MTARLAKVRASPIWRLLFTYGVGCFAVLQLADVLAEPMHISAGAIRSLTIAMLLLAPVVTFGYGLWKRQQRRSATFDTAGVQNDVFCIAQAVLDTRSRQLRFDGRLEDVQPKVFDLIEYLVRSRDRVVSKEELLNEVWPDVVVSEASLTQSIKRARDHFRQHGMTEDVIRTVARKGYQFSNEVSEENAGTPLRSSTWLELGAPVLLTALLAGALLLTVTQRQLESLPLVTIKDIPGNSVAVLPFDNLTPEAAFDYFSNGLTETLINNLAAIPGLRIIARTSAFAITDDTKDFALIGERLGVAHVLQGSVQRNANELRISARLLRTHDGSQLWSRQYNRLFDDIFVVQDDISSAVAKQLGALLSVDSPAASTDSSRANASADKASMAQAYALLMQGREAKRQLSNAAIQRAENFFRQALELAPDYSEAKSELSTVLFRRSSLGEIPRDEGFAEALELAAEAIQDNPDNGSAYISLGELQHRHLWNFRAAAESFKKAITLLPGSAQAHAAYSRFLGKSGRTLDAANEARIASTLDPRSSNVVGNLIMRLMRVGDLPAARQALDRLGENHPDLADRPWFEANWHILNGSYREALEWIAREELDYLRLNISAIALFNLERTEQARDALDTLIASDPEGAAYQIAAVYAHWGRSDEAFEWFDRAYRNGDPGLSELYSSLNLGPVEGDSRFAALAARVGLPATP